VLAAGLLALLPHAWAAHTLAHARMRRAELDEWAKLAQAVFPF
jgi:hypothetical protein